MARVRVPALQNMPEEHIIRHLELRHPEDLRMKFKPLPGRSERRLEARSAWITYHDTLHRLALNGGYEDHYHALPAEVNKKAG